MAKVDPTAELIHWRVELSQILNIKLRPNPLSPAWHFQSIDSLLGIRVVGGFPANASPLPSSRTRRARRKVSWDRIPRDRGSFDNPEQSTIGRQLLSTQEHHTSASLGLAMSESNLRRCTWPILKTQVRKDPPQVNLQPYEFSRSQVFWQTYRRDRGLY